MEEVIKALNQLVADGKILNYAIGGAVGAAFYIQAVQTEDVDAFLFLPPSASGLVSLSPIYAALVRLGGHVDREYVRFGAWPLQILTDANPLIFEAIRDAESTTFAGVATRVFSPEHLCAVALQTGRRKDYLRVSGFLEQQAVDTDQLRALLLKYDLLDRLERAKPVLKSEELHGPE